MVGAGTPRLRQATTDETFEESEDRLFNSLRGEIAKLRGENVRLKHHIEKSRSGNDNDINDQNCEASTSAESTEEEANLPHKQNHDDQPGPS